MLQYHITQDPRIARQFGGHVELFRETLASHRAALKLEPTNADILFNTAQVLRSLAEALDDQDDANPEEQIKLVQESVELFAMCLSKQETEYERNQAMMKESDDQTRENATAEQQQQQQPPPQKDEDASSTSDEAGDWATVEEPITPSALLETALAQLDALTMLIGLSSPADPNTLSTIAGIAQPLITDKIPAYLPLISSASPAPPPIAEGASLSISATSTTFTSAGSSSSYVPGPSPQEQAGREVRLCIANWSAALADSQYRSGTTSLDTYSSQVHYAFAYVTPSSIAQSSTRPASAAATTSVDDLSAFADALMEFDSSAADSAGNLEVRKIRWTALSTAQELLKEASDNLGAKKPSIYLARGDIDLKRSRLSSLDIDANAGSASDVTERVLRLLSNAGVYYRGASALADQARRRAGRGDGDDDDEDEWKEAEVKGQMVLFAAALLTGSKPEGLGGLSQKGIDGEETRRLLEEMVEDGLVDAQMAEAYLEAVGGGL